MTQTRKFGGLFASCPKCTSSAVCPSYCKGVPRGISIWGGGDDCRITEEHLHRKCSICGYSWLEDCAEKFVRDVSNQ